MRMRSDGAFDVPAANLASGGKPPAGGAPSSQEATESGKLRALAAASFQTVLLLPLGCGVPVSWVGRFVRGAFRVVTAAAVLFITCNLAAPIGWPAEHLIAP